MVVWGKGGKVIEIPFVVGVGMSPSQIEQGGSLSQLEWGRYITPSKPIKRTQTILEKAQRRSNIANSLDNGKVSNFHGG